MPTRNTGILGVGTFLPQTIKRNADWSPEIVAGWKEKLQRRVVRLQGELEKASTEGERAVLSELLKLTDDPFQGVESLHYMDPGMTAADMESAAARQAIAAAKIDPKEIDLVLGYTMCPDYINVPTACVVHDKLGLSPKAMTFNVEAVCNSFIMQMTIAQQFIQNGTFRYALLTQSSCVTRHKQSGEPHDAWLGAGAGAVVVGPVDEGAGILSYAHRVDGSLHKAVVVGIPGGHWWDDGAPIAYSEDHAANYNMAIKIADRAQDVLGEVFAKTGIAPETINFFACHQAFVWLRRVCQSHTGMVNAKSVDTCTWAGTISAANIPLILANGMQQDILHRGDLVALFQGGTGMTWSGMLLRWA